MRILFERETHTHTLSLSLFFRGRGTCFFLMVKRRNEGKLCRENKSWVTKLRARGIVSRMPRKLQPVVVCLRVSSRAYFSRLFFRAPLLESDIVDARHFPSTLYIYTREGISLICITYHGTSALGY